MGNPKKEDRLPLEFTHEYEMKDRILYFDVDYLTNVEGRFKVIEICLCLLSLFLVSASKGVNGERNLVIIIGVACILITVAVWLSKVFTLHRQLTPKHWFCMELLVYSFLVGALSFATGFLTVFGVLYWGVRNPEWQTLPIMAACALVATITVYIIDVCVLYQKRNNRTFIPDVSTYRL